MHWHVGRDMGGGGKGANLVALVDVWPVLVEGRHGGGLVGGDLHR